MLDCIQRILRAPPGRVGGWLMLALRLSGIPRPGPRPHHRRIAAAVLDDAAARNNGQLFALANGDIVLLFRPTDAGAATAAVLTRLFQADGADPAALCPLWPIPAAALQAVDYIQQRVSETTTVTQDPEPKSSASFIAALDAVVQRSAQASLMQRQIAVLIRPGRPDPLTPIFREIGISMAALEARLPPGDRAAADPFLFSYLAARMDRRMLAAMKDDILDGGKRALGLSDGLGPAAIHLNLTLSGILSEGFADFAAACQASIKAGLRIGVELPFVEVFADAKAFVLARERLRLAGLQVILDGVTHHAMTLTSPAALEPDMVKLDWSPQMPELGPPAAAALTEAIARLDPNRIVLHRAESEGALAWGLTRGIRRFQGRYVDSMLAAERLRACPSAAACTLAQCKERGAAIGTPLRDACLNNAMLDRAVPLYVAVRPPAPAAALSA